MYFYGRQKNIMRIVKISAENIQKYFYVIFNEYCKFARKYT